MGCLSGLYNLPHYFFHSSFSKSACTDVCFELRVGTVSMFLFVSPPQVALISLISRRWRWWLYQLIDLTPNWFWECWLDSIQRHGINGQHKGFQTDASCWANRCKIVFSLHPHSNLCASITSHHVTSHTSTTQRWEAVCLLSRFVASCFEFLLARTQARLRDGSLRRAGALRPGPAPAGCSGYHNGSEEQWDVPHSVRRRADERPGTVCFGSGFCTSIFGAPASRNIWKVSLELSDQRQLLKH